MEIRERWGMTCGRERRTEGAGSTEPKSLAPLPDLCSEFRGVSALQAGLDTPLPAQLKKSSTLRTDTAHLRYG